MIDFGDCCELMFCETKQSFVRCLDEDTVARPFLPFAGKATPRDADKEELHA
jgi:hypothetical protein